MTCRRHQKHRLSSLLCALVLALFVTPALGTEPHATSTPGSHSPTKAVTIPGLGPCNDDTDRTMHLDPAQPVTILVHGCNGSAGRFRTLSQVMAYHDQQSVCFSYDDRDSLMKSSGELVDAIELLARQLDSPRITVMGHSQGGLVARKALVEERTDSLNSDARLNLVTVSAPFSGIRAARMCANPYLRVATLGLNDLICWAISGDKWYEITYASSFIEQPGTLVPSVETHLKILTDERETCRRYSATDECIEDDYVFSLEEQILPEVLFGVLPTSIEIKAGHVEIVGENGTTPRDLIAVLQQQGVIRPTAVADRDKFDRFLTDLYSVREDTARVGRIN